MFIAEGAHWRWQRRAAAPVFSHRNIAALAPIMSARAQAASDRLAAANGEADVFDEMVRTTFEVISDVTFSGSGAMDPDAVHRAIDAYIDQTARVSLFDIMGVPTWVPRLSRLFGPNSLTKMKEIADQSINARRASGPKDIPDLLDLLMEGEDPKSGRQMNQSELRDNLLAFIVAGHETTALTLGWALYLCAFDPKVQEKLRAESQSVLNGRTATYDDVTKMPYCEQVIKETLRLYPPLHSCHAPPKTQTHCAVAISNPKTPLCCRSMHCTETNCCGTTPIRSIQIALAKAQSMTASVGCPLAMAPASASAAILP